MKPNGVIIAMFIIFFLLILNRYREKYTSTDRDKIHQVLSGYDRINLIKYMNNTIINELENNTTGKLSNVNLLVDTLSTGRSTPWAHYTTVEEFDTMLATAWKPAGESALSSRDRMVLRAIAMPGIDFTVDTPLNPITYTNEYVPDFSADIIRESGRSARDMLLFCFKAIEKIYNNQTSGMTPEVVDFLNSYLPDTFSPKFDRNNIASVNDAFEGRTGLDAKTIWIFKAMVLGPCYIAQLAENKWRLDLTWRP